MFKPRKVSRRIRAGGFCVWVRGTVQYTVEEDGTDKNKDFKKGKQAGSWGEYLKKGGVLKPTYE